MSEDNSELFNKKTVVQSVKESPDMWTGSANQLENSKLWLVREDEIVIESVQYNPVFAKIIDELVVNALDQATISTKVTEIKIIFKSNNGVFSIYNNGTNIPVEIHTKEKIYIPELIFFVPLSGSNFKSLKAKGSKKTSGITGGKNGIGAKLANIFSEKFQVETVDMSKKLYYKQISSHSMSVINEPIIKKVSEIQEESRHNFTKITILPSYEYLLMTSKRNPEIPSYLIDLIRTRAQFAALCTKSTVSFNNEILSGDLSEFVVRATGFNKDSFHEFTIPYPGNKNLDWKAIVVISSAKKQFNLSFVNGIHTMKGGRHVKFVTDAIYDINIKAIKSKLKKEYTKQDVNKFISLFLITKIVDASYTSQDKSYLNGPTTFGNTIPQAVIKKMAAQLIICLTEKIDSKKAPTISSRDLLKIKKYEPALRAGTKEAKLCRLFIPEGDSAANFIQVSRVSTDPDIIANRVSIEYCGIYNISGKPPNTRKETDIIRMPDNSIKIMKSAMLEKNERFESLRKVLGLNYQYHYRRNPEGDKQFAQLRYGCIVVAVDQDVDGVGHIFGLIINHVHRIWPALFERNFVQRIATPLIIARPKHGQKKLVDIDFRSQFEFEEWIKSDHAQPHKYDISYYKGLAGHNNKSSNRIFRNLKDNLYTYILDEESDRLFEVYFGKDTEIRKAELRHPIQQYPIPKNKIISCSKHLQCETREFQLEDIIRSLPHIIDGLRPAARLVLAEAFRSFKSPNDLPIKVCALANAAALRFKYEHGSASLEETIVTMNQCFPGARNIPLLDGSSSSFGSRSEGGDNAGASRYITTRLNYEIAIRIFPQEDNDLLEYKFSENEKCEPKYYVPIIPMAVLENFKIPATGWSSTICARNVFDVISEVRHLIENTTSAKSKITERMRLRYWNKDSICDVYEHSRNLIIVGQCYVKDNCIYVEDLPPGLWPKYVCESLIEKSFSEKKEYQFIDTVINNSSDYRIDIRVIMKPGFKEYIEDNYGSPYIDPFADYLKIYKILKSSCNFLGINNTVFEADLIAEQNAISSGYEVAILEWFKVRKQLYISRVERQRIILEWKIYICENTIRYVNSAKEYSVLDKGITIVNQELQEAGYLAINSSRFDKIADIPTKEISTAITTNANYSYLLDLRDRDKLEDSNKKRYERLELLRKELEYVTRDGGEFPGSHIWNEELDELEFVLRNFLANMRE